MHQAVSAQRVLRIRPATSAVKPATSPVTAPTQLLRVLDVVSNLVDPKSATR